MATVINSYGVEINYDAAVELMDDETREAVCADLAPPVRNRNFLMRTPPPILSNLVRTGSWTQPTPSIDKKGGQLNAYNFCQALAEHRQNRCRRG